MFVNATYEIALKATNGFIESNGSVVPMRRMPPSLAAWRGAADDAGAAVATPARQSAMRQSSLRAVMRSPAVRGAARAAPERGGYALAATQTMPPAVELLPCPQTRGAHGGLALRADTDAGRPRTGSPVRGRRSPNA